MWKTPGFFNANPNGVFQEAVGKPTAFPWPRHRPLPIPLSFNALKELGYGKCRPMEKAFSFPTGLGKPLMGFPHFPQPLLLLIQRFDLKDVTHPQCLTGASFSLPRVSGRSPDIHPETGGEAARSGWQRDAPWRPLRCLRDKLRSSARQFSWWSSLHP